MKKKIYIIGFILVGILLSVSLTYSVFNDESNLSSTNENFAKFIFNTEDSAIQQIIINDNPIDICVNLIFLFSLFIFFRKYDIISIPMNNC